ncbi:flavin reductase family protein [Desulfoluna sp.]|uniref:flavin reductase family protein n=1 Tax=Desulfoluna sp. TaxID=2045199 RepID=UPI0026369651|nr:flavin reductase family protein [Desulfoluna sp.]
MILKPFMREGIMPLPVSFISTISKEGIRNIAPYSCIMPVLRPLDLICFASAEKRDTLINIRETGEFVINLPGIDFEEKVIPTAKMSAPEIDEYELAHLEEKPSQTIKAPGIQGCYAWMECRLEKEFKEANYSLVMGKVLRLEVKDEVLDDNHHLNPFAANPLMMTGSQKGMHFCTIRETNGFEPFAAMFPTGVDPVTASA